MLRSNYEV